ncbi:MAG TPA: phosphoribosyltransferase family protein [Solirubrobacterales bacterium]
MTPLVPEAVDPFADRREAGRLLAERLAPLAAERPVVVGLARGGVPVASEVADALGAPLEVLVVRKLGAPHNPEYGIGAIAEEDTLVVDPEAVAGLGISRIKLDAIIERESAELRRRVEAYRDGRPRLEMEGRTVIVVDDGVATGVTDTAALRAVRKLGPRHTVLAVPVSSYEAAERLAAEADDLICLELSLLMRGVGGCYEDFTQVSDEEVIVALRAHGDGGVPSPGRERTADGAPRA